MSCRVVFDSNVAISAFLFGGMPRQLMSYAMRGSIKCFTSMALLDEIQGVLRRPKFGLTARQELFLMREITDLLEIVVPQEKVAVVIDDPDDDMVLECALAARADMIVSGDHHLLDLGAWRGIEIMTPAMAMQLLGRR